MATPTYSYAPGTSKPFAIMSKVIRFLPKFKKYSTTELESS